MDLLTRPEELAEVTRNMDHPTVLLRIISPGLKREVTHKMKLENGVERPYIVTRLTGQALYLNNEKEIMADEAVFCDYGKRQGVTRSFERHKDVEVTPEERAANRQHVIDVATKCLIDQGIW